MSRHSIMTRLPSSIEGGAFLLEKTVNSFLLNNILLIAIIFVCVFSLAWPVIQRRKGGSELDSTSAIDLINHKNAQIVDLRQPEDFKRAHIANSINLPATTIQNSLGKLSKERPVLLVDADGRRTQMVAQLLRGTGFKGVFVLQGGLNAWRTSGVPFSR